MVVACVEKQGEGSGEYSAAGAIEAEPIQEILCNTIPKCSGVQRILHATIFFGWAIFWGGTRQGPFFSKTA